MYDEAYSLDKLPTNSNRDKMIDDSSNNYSKNIFVTWNLKGSNKKLYLNHFKIKSIWYNF